MIAVAGGGDEGYVMSHDDGFKVGREERGDVEELFGAGEEGFGVEVFEAVDDAVGGQDGDAGCVHVDEGHHHGCFGEGWGWKVAGLSFPSSPMGGKG